MKRVLAGIAPEADLEALDSGADLRESLDYLCVRGAC